MGLYHDAERTLKEKYNIDLLEEIVLARGDRAIYFVEYLRDGIFFTKIHGKSPLDLLPQGDHFEFSLIDDIFDMNSKYGEVAGKTFYKNKNISIIRNMNGEANITIPLLIDGQRRWVRFHSYSTKQKNGKTLVASCYVTDVTKYLIHEEKLYEKTHKDELTHLFNRYALYYHFELWGNRTPITSFYFDIDDFKMYNDTYGHEVGDEILKIFAQELLSIKSEHFTAYRLGGDEFYALLVETEPNELEDIVHQLQTMMKSCKVEGVDHPLSLSIGVVTTHDDITEKYVAFMKAGDTAMYESKYAGKNRATYQTFKVFTRE